MTPTAYDEWLGRTIARPRQGASIGSASERLDTRLGRVLLAVAVFVAATIACAGPASAAAGGTGPGATTDQVFDPAYSQWLTVAAIIGFCSVGLAVAALIIAGLRRANHRAAVDEAETAAAAPVRTPYRGDVARLFDVDLAAARRRRSAAGPATSADQVRDKNRASTSTSSGRGRESAWSGRAW